MHRECRFVLMMNSNIYISKSVTKIINMKVLTYSSPSVPYQLSTSVLQLQISPHRSCLRSSWRPVLLRPSSFSLNGVNIMCFSVNCPRNLAKSGMWRARVPPTAHRLQSNCVGCETRARRDTTTRTPILHARHKSFDNYDQLQIDIISRLKGRVRCFYCDGNVTATTHVDGGRVYFTDIDLSSCSSAHLETMRQWMTVRKIHTSPI